MIKLLPIVYLLATVLATWRLTEMVTADEIFAKLRAKFPIYILSCPRCVSVWAGIATTAMYLWFPNGNLVLALAWLYLAHVDSRLAKQISKTGRQLSVVVRDGQLMVLRNELTPSELFNLRESITVNPPVK